MRCHACAFEIPALASVCPACGEDFTEPREPAPTKKKRFSVMALLSLLFSLASLCLMGLTATLNAAAIFAILGLPLFQILDGSTMILLLWLVSIPLCPLGIITLPAAVFTALLAILFGLVAQIKNRRVYVSAILGILGGLAVPALSAMLLLIDFAGGLLWFLVIIPAFFPV